MVNGVLGENGNHVLLPVVEEHVQNNEIVITPHRKMEGKPVTSMDLPTKSQKAVTMRLVLVYKYFYYSATDS